MAYLVKATEEHVRALAPILRLADRAEIESLTGLEPLEVLLRHIKFHEAEAVFSDAGELAGMCVVGVCLSPVPDHPHGASVEVGRLWGVGTHILEERPIEFLRASRKWIGAQLQRFPSLHWYMDARHSKGIDWLEWLGFSVYFEPQPFGIHGLPFHSAHMLRHEFHDGAHRPPRSWRESNNALLRRWLASRRCGPSPRP